MEACKLCKELKVFPDNSIFKSIVDPKIRSYCDLLIEKSASYGDKGKLSKVQIEIVELMKISLFCRDYILTKYDRLPENVKQIIIYHTQKGLLPLRDFEKEYLIDHFLRWKNLSDCDTIRCSTCYTRNYFCFFHSQFMEHYCCVDYGKHISMCMGCQIMTCFKNKRCKGCENAYTLNKLIDVKRHKTKTRHTLSDLDPYRTLYRRCSEDSIIKPFSDYGIKSPT